MVRAGTRMRCWCWRRVIRSDSPRYALLADACGVARGAQPGRRAGPDDAVYLLDTLGDLQAFYSAADAAFVGGSLVPVGGHSLLEPASLGLPLLSGPHVHNAPDVAALLAGVGALEIVNDADGALACCVAKAFEDPKRTRPRRRGREAVAANRGAVDASRTSCYRSVSRPARLRLRQLQFRRRRQERVDRGEVARASTPAADFRFTTLIR